MESERELHLMNQIKQLKKRINQMEELAVAQDDDFRERLNEWSEQKKLLTAKNNALESKMFTISEENTELAETVEKLQKLAEKNVPQKPIETPLNVMSESFVTDYNGLQDKVDELNEDKITLEAKVREMETFMKEMVQKLEELESVNAELTEALSSVNNKKQQLLEENKYMAESVTTMQMQLDTLGTPVLDQKELGNSLFIEFEAENQKTLKQKAEMEQEITVLRKTLSSFGEEERRKAIDLECMRETMKNLSEKNKFLAKELEIKNDAEAEYIAIKGAARKIEKENELLKNEVARLKKQFVAAESRADENAHILSKATSSQANFYKHIQEQADVSNVQSTPRPVLKQRTQSLTRTEEADSGYRILLGRKPSTIRSSYETLISQFRPSTSKDDAISRKRGIMLDYSEPVNRRKLDFKLQKLSGRNKSRELDHLKSHYDPATGSYDQSHGESPKSAAKLSTPKKENRILNSILRKK